MRISIHQPHYLPWLPLIYKIIISDVFVFLDHVNYSKNDWVNRNKLKNANGSFFLTIPVKKKNGNSIKQISICGDEWKSKHLKSFYYNYNS
ncbi:WbqC family protein, partial [Xenorhabdus bovienii]|uniref:WbqC family protein n=1 Tax=Xenorhabdus bovienii TaxID=40576 RepID=UPI003DA6235D